MEKYRQVVTTATRSVTQAPMQAVCGYMETSLNSEKLYNLTATCLLIFLAA